MGKALTTPSIEAMKPDPARRIERPDPALSGLYLVVQPSGAKSWALRYRYRGRPKKLTLGRWPVMGIAAARSAASEALEKIAHGADPAAEKRATKRAAAEDPGRDTIRALVEQHDRRHLSKLRSGRLVRRELDRHVVARWGDRDADTITRRDILDLLDEIVDSGRGTTANRLRAYLGTFFNWCVDRGILEANPVAGVKSPARENTRERTLSDNEIRWFWRACEDVGPPWAAIGHLLLLTGQRLGEVAGMTDDEIDAALWSLSGTRTKNGRAHTVPLSKPALAVLAAHERIATPAGLLFTTNGRTAPSGFSKVRDRIAGRMVEIAAEERGQPVDIPHWTFHDLRRTAATGMARLGQPVHVVEAVLNHVSGAISGVAGVYNRHGYDDEKRKALEAWARFVQATVKGSRANVVEISRVRQ